MQVNRVNPRKEFFRCDIEMLHQLVEKHHGKVDYVATPEALEYRESQSMTDDDFEYITEQQEKLEKESGPSSTEAE
jgi:hypothetical protein